jgi:2TM domain-containing protein
MTALKDIEQREEPGLRETAIDRLKKRQDFHAHLLIYVLFNAVLWGIWALTNPGGFPWAAIPSAIWGIGVIMNAWDVYGRRPFSEAEIQHEIERLRHP